ncbi:MAG: M50 family metallopeptidase [Alkalibacterium sp.]|uniref:M50 family metallopeptidase n=1 Tax=Alkalibacterium sp. TaxID=1872447 RepID=UPI0039706976
MKQVFLILNIFITFLGLGFLGYEVGMLSAIHDWTWIHIPVFMSYFVVSFFLHIVIHEAGHLVAGLLSGYSFSMFKLLSFIWVKESGKITLKKQPVPGMLGQCLMMPPEKIASPPYALYHLGGIIANLIAAAGGYLMWMMPFPPLVKVGFLTFTVVGIVLAMMNLIPVGPNDGMHLWKASRNIEYQIQFNQLLQIHAGMIKGKTARELQGLLYFVGKEPLTDGNNTTMLSLKALKDIEEFKFDQAEMTLRPLWDQFDQVLELQKFEVLKEYLFVLLLSHPDDKAVAEIVNNKWFKKQENVKQADTKRVLATYAFVKENDYEKAVRLLDEAESYIKKAPTLTDQKIERKLNDYLRRELLGHE